MNKILKYKILAALLTLAVLFPFAVQALHAFEIHEHVVCTAKDVKHFHNQEIDCSIFHTTVENQSDHIGFEYEILTNKKFTQYFLCEVDTTSLGCTSLKSSRAPPYFIV